MREYPKGVWLDPKMDLPVVFENEAGFETSERVLIIGYDACIWLAFWNGEVWINANSPDIMWMDKNYVMAWMSVPKFEGKFHVLREDYIR